MDLTKLYLVILMAVSVNADCASVIEQKRQFWLATSTPTSKCDNVERFVSDVYEDNCVFSSNEEQTLIDLAKSALGTSSCSYKLQDLINTWRAEKACQTDVKKCPIPATESDGTFKKQESTCNDIVQYVKCKFSRASCQYMFTTEVKERSANSLETTLAQQGIKCSFKILDVINGSENLTINTSLIMTVSFMVFILKNFFACY